MILFVAMEDKNMTLYHLLFSTYSSKFMFWHILWLAKIYYIQILIYYIEFERLNANINKNKYIRLPIFFPYYNCLTRKYFSNKNDKNEILEIRRNSVIESSHVSFISLLSFPFIQKCNRKQNYVLSSKLREYKIRVSFIILEYSH